MKLVKLISLLLLATFLVGCAGSEPAAPEVVPTEAGTPAPTAEPTPEPTPKPTPEVYNGVLNYYFKELYLYFQNHPVELELVDDKTIRANIKQEVFYKREFVDQLEVGHTVVLPDREILVETLENWESANGQSYIINSGSDNCIRLEQDIYKGDDFCLYDAKLWPIYASTLSVDLTYHKNFYFIDCATDNPELNGKEQTFNDLVDAMKNNEVNLEHTRIWLAEDEFSYTTVFVQRTD